MDDRTWTGISFSGHITVEQAEELCEELMQHRVTIRMDAADALRRRAFHDLQPHPDLLERLFDAVVGDDDYSGPPIERAPEPDRAWAEYCAAVLVNEGEK